MDELERLRDEVAWLRSVVERLAAGQPAARALRDERVDLRGRPVAQPDDGPAIRPLDPAEHDRKEAGPRRTRRADR